MEKVTGMGETKSFCTSGYLEMEAVVNVDLLTLQCSNYNISNLIGITVIFSFKNASVCELQKKGGIYINVCVLC